MKPEDFKKIDDILERINNIANLKSKLTAFCIGTTNKIPKNKDFIFTPIRITRDIVAGSVLVFVNSKVREISKYLDGKVELILADIEKKGGSDLKNNEGLFNIEREIFAIIKKSKIITYKANDISVESLDLFITQFLAKNFYRAGGKNALIVGVGNIGSKIALKLVERGINVYIFRKDLTKAELISKALNVIKPINTQAKVVVVESIDDFTISLDILIGLTNGPPAIKKNMVKNLKTSSLVIDAGKGTFDEEFKKMACKKNITIYRTDIRYAFDSYISLLIDTEKMLTTLGRRKIKNISLVSASILGKKGEVVVDNIADPKIIYGIADGNGDLIIKNSLADENKLKQLEDVFKFN